MEALFLFKPMHFADNLLDRIQAKGAPVCVGIDPVYHRLPQQFRTPQAAAADPRTELDAVTAFASRVIEVVASHVPCVKIQSACFERYHGEGVERYHALVHEAQARGLLVIGDVKRGDIGPSAAHYAAAGLTDPPDTPENPAASPDAITISSYFGEDGLRPFLDAAAREGKGLFALVRTSNPGADAIQATRLEDGRTFAQRVAELVDGFGGAPRYLGQSGYSLLGAVVGATRPHEAAELRRLMPRQLFLVPGFGAQGGEARDVRACFHEDGTGGVVTSSRSIIYAWEHAETRDWAAAVEQAALTMKDSVVRVLHAEGA